MKRGAVVVLGIAATAGLFLGIGSSPMIKERVASAHCDAARDCGACCATEGCSSSEQTTDPATGAAIPGSCRCHLTPSDSVLARPVASTSAAPVGTTTASDAALGRPCRAPADCGAGHGCMRFDDAGHLVPMQSANGALRCTRTCDAGCPVGFHCSALDVPVTGAAPVTISACAPDVAR